MKHISAKTPLFCGTLLLSSLFCLQAAANQCCVEYCCEEAVLCYVPPYYEPPTCWGVFAEGDFLYWFARENTLSYAVELNVKETNPPDPTSVSQGVSGYNYLNSKWNRGYRIGIGSAGDCKGWDTYVTWTSYNNKKSDTASTPPSNALVINEPGQTSLLNPWINSSIRLASDPNIELQPGVFFDQIKATWKLEFRQIDAQIGYKYWVSPKFTLRPYAGLRAALIKPKFTTESSNSYIDSTTGASVDLLFEDEFSGKSDGIGLLVGLEPSWFLCDSFSLFANFDSSLIWGKYQSKKQENYQAKELLTNVLTPILYFDETTSASFFKMQTAFDLALGLSYEESWFCGKFRGSIDFGWEHHIWLDYTFRHVSEGSSLSVAQEGNAAFTSISSFDKEESDLVIEGFFLRLRFDF